MKTFVSKLFFRQPTVWDAEEPLICWGVGTRWTVGLSYEGSAQFGASGSGKSSGGVHLQTVAMMKAGYGMLFLTTKSTSPADADLCLAMARESGRADSVVQVGPSHRLGFNLLRYEMLTAEENGEFGDMASNVAALFSAAADLAMTNRANNTGEQIWRQAVESLVRHAVTVVYNATGDLQLDDIVQVVKSAPQSLSQMSDPSWLRESRCMQMLERSADRPQRNMQLAREYFHREFPTYPPETKNSVLFSFSAGCADLFQREPLHSMFFASTDYTPDILLDGAILLCDCPVLEYREVGRIANGLLRLSVQRALERRSKTLSRRPVAIIWDEAQKTLLRSDVSFQETARSACCATVAATQHIPAIREVVGKDLATAFLGNLRTKLFFQNNEQETGEFMDRLCGKKEVLKKTHTKDSAGKLSTNESYSSESALPPEATHNLRTGGREHSFLVEAFLVVGSKKLRGGEPYRKIRIHQRKIASGGVNRRSHVVAQQRPSPDFRYLKKGR